MPNAMSASGVSLGLIGAALIDGLSAFLAVLLGAAGLHKLLGFARARAAAHAFGGVPSRFAPAAAAGALTAELGACLMLALPGHRAAGALIAAALWGGYLLLFVRAAALGLREVDCGCSFGAAHHRVGGYHVARNAALTAAAILVALAGGSAAPPASQWLGALALLALYGALEQTLALGRPRPAGGAA